MSAPVSLEVMKESDVDAVAAMAGPTRMDVAQLREEIHRPWSRLWVARQDDEVVAYLVAWHVADELHVLNLATREDRRRQGVGRALLEEVVTYARVQHVAHILLEVRRSNRPAIGLYRSVGFFAIGVRTRYYPDDEDAVEMVLALDPSTGAILPRADEVRVEA